IGLTCFNTPAVLASISVRVNKSIDSIPNQHLIANNKVAESRERGFFGRLKNGALSFLFYRREKGEGTVSIKAALGWVSLGLILTTFLFIGSAAAGVTLLTGIVMGIVSLAIKKNQNEIRKKKKSNMPAIIALSLVLALFIFYA